MNRNAFLSGYLRKNAVNMNERLAAGGTAPSPALASTPTAPAAAVAPAPSPAIKPMKDIDAKPALPTGGSSNSGLIGAPAGAAPSLIKDMTDKKA